MTSDEFKIKAIELAKFEGLSSNVPYSFFIYGLPCPGVRTLSRRMTVFLNHYAVVQKRPTDMWVNLEDMVLYRMNAFGKVSSDEIEYSALFTEIENNQ